MGRFNFVVSVTPYQLNPPSFFHRGYAVQDNSLDGRVTKSKSES